MTRNNIISKVQNFEEKLVQFYIETGCSILEIDITINGLRSIIHYRVLKTKITRVEIEDPPFNTSYKDEYHFCKELQMEDLLEQLKHDQRRLNKSWAYYNNTYYNKKHLMDGEID